MLRRRQMGQTPYSGHYHPYGNGRNATIEPLWSQAEKHYRKLVNQSRIAVLIKKCYMVADSFPVDEVDDVMVSVVGRH